jgi:hypothetical protein
MVPSRKLITPFLSIAMNSKILKLGIAAFLLGLNPEHCTGVREYCPIWVLGEVQSKESEN